MNDLGAWTAIVVLFLIGLAQLGKDLLFKLKDDRLEKKYKHLRDRVKRLESSSGIHSEPDSDTFPFRERA